ncbi:MAG TPA: dihydropteroate synthase, partial [Candidatus Solibacter sp.]|nr:dihydropteroate synthase [Candidatus Solibacter sp.]
QSRKTFKLKMRSRTLELGERTLVMGVLNVTPDSFSDGGRYSTVRAAVARAMEMEAEGADIIDIGGESTRPGSEGVSAEAELERVLPVLLALRGRLKIPISIDTQKAAVAEAAIEAGAEMVNDVSALRGPEGSGRAMGEVVRRAGVPIVLMHMRGKPKTMQRRPFARDVMGDVTKGLREALGRARRAGIPRGRVILDPGIGFGKSTEQNCELLARLGELKRLGCPLLIGASRKTFIGKLLGGASEEKRAWGTAAAVTAAVLGGAQIVRVHDVGEMAQVVRVAEEIRKEMRGRRQRNRQIE